MAFSENISYRIVRSRRRSISIEIDKNGKLILRMPLRLPERLGTNFIEEKSLWIRKKIAVAEKRTQLPKKFIAGETFLLLGNKYPLVFTSRRITGLIFENDSFFVSERSRGKIKKKFKIFYKTIARDFIQKIVQQYSDKFGLQYTNIKITSARTRWGSCSNRGNLSFSWRLIMSPESIVEYVVVHEMAHLKHGNHSKKFWQEVERMMPDYNVRKKWLKENGHTLTLD